MAKKEKSGEKGNAPPHHHITRSFLIQKMRWDCFPLKHSFKPCLICRTMTCFFYLNWMKNVKKEGVTTIIKNFKKRNFPNAWVSGKFLKYLQIFECGIFLRFWKFLKWLEIFKIPRHLGNSPNTQTFEEFPKCPDIPNA